MLEYIVCANIMAHMDEQQVLSDRQHAFRKWHSCETQLTAVINDQVKLLEDRLTHLFWTSRRLLTHTLMNYLKANYPVMALTERWIDSFFVIEHNELL